jgi:Kelch motif
MNHEKAREKSDSTPSRSVMYIKERDSVKNLERDSVRNMERESVKSVKRPTVKIAPILKNASLSKPSNRKVSKKNQSHSVDQGHQEGSVSEKPKLVARRKASVDLLMFPKNAVSQYNFTSMDVSMLSIAGLPQPEPPIEEDFDQHPAKDTIGNQLSAYPTLLTASGMDAGKFSQRVANLKNRSLERMDTVDQPHSSLLGSFMPLAAIKASPDYIDLKKKLADDDRLMAIKKQLRYNRKSTDKYRKAVRKANDSILERIVEFTRYDNRHEGLSNKIVIKKSQNDIDRDLESDEDSIAFTSARDISLAWYPRKEMLGGPMEFREGRALCLINSHAYMLGGYSTGGNKFDALMCYDISTNSLKVCPTGKTFPGQRAYHSMVYVNDGIYIYGGELIRRSVDTLYYDDVWRYDLKSMKFRSVRTPTRIPGRKDHVAFAFGNNYMIVSGGVSDQKTCLGDMWVLPACNI